LLTLTRLDIGLFDHVITNEDLEKCYEELKGLVKADVAAVQALNVNFRIPHPQPPLIRASILAIVTKRAEQKSVGANRL
jgi:hypothetical protein